MTLKEFELPAQEQFERMMLRSIVATNPLVKKMANALAGAAQKLWLNEMKRPNGGLARYTPDHGPSCELTTAIDLLRILDDGSGIWPGAGFIELFDQHDDSK